MKFLIMENGTLTSTLAISIASRNTGCNGSCQMTVMFLVNMFFLFFSFSNGGEEKSGYYFESVNLPNDYSGDVSTIDRIDLLCYAMLSGLKAKDSCWYNITTTWNCATYVTDGCKRETEETVTKVASSNGATTDVDYKFKSKLMWEYELCSCKNWMATVVGEDGNTYATNNLGCNPGWSELSGYSHSTLFNLPPNNATNKKYTITAYLISTRKKKKENSNNSKAKQKKKTSSIQLFS